MAYLYFSCALILAVASGTIGQSTTTPGPKAVQSTQQLRFHPIVSCNKDPTEFHWSFDQCIDRCQSSLDYDHTVMIEFKKSTHKTIIPLARCKKIKKTQIFTETWTFSQVQNNPVTEELVITEAECLKEWKSKCSGKPCHTSDPEVPAEFHYASDTSKSITYIVVSAFESAVTGFKAGAHYIMYKGQQITMDRVQGYSFSPYDVLVWDGQPKTDDLCHWETEYSELCIKEKDKDNYYCPESGVLLLDYHQADTKCSAPVYLDSTGTVFTKSESIHSSSTDMIPIIKATDSEKADLSFRSLLMNFKNRDLVMCIDSCTRFDIKKVGVIQRYGLSLVAVKNSTGIHQCHIHTACAPIIPLKICNNPRRVMVKCGHQELWWMLERDFSYESSVCHGVIKGNGLTLPYGNGLIVVNASGVFYLPVSPVADHLILGKPMNPGFVVKAEDLTSSHSDGSIQPPSLTEDETNVQGIQLPDYFNRFSSWIREIGHDTKVLIITIILLIFGGSLVYKWLSPGGDRPMRRMRSVSSPGKSGVIYL